MRFRLCMTGLVKTSRWRGEGCRGARGFDRARGMILDRQRRVEGRAQRTADMFRDAAAALLDERRRRAEEAIQQPDHLRLLGDRRAG